MLNPTTVNKPSFPGSAMTTWSQFDHYAAKPSFHDMCDHWLLLEEGILWSLDIILLCIIGRWIKDEMETLHLLLPFGLFFPSWRHERCHRPEKMVTLQHCYHFVCQYLKERKNLYISPMTGALAMPAVWHANQVMIRYEAATKLPRTKSSCSYARLSLTVHFRLQQRQVHDTGGVWWQRGRTERHDKGK